MKNHKMILFRLLPNRYFLAFSALYLIAAWYLLIGINTEPGDVIATLIVIGFGFCTVAYLLSYAAKPLFADRKLLQHEGWWLFALIVFSTAYLTIGSKFLDALLPDSLLLDEVSNSFILLFSKLTVFVFVPFLVYRFVLDFPQYELGFRYSWKDVVNRKSVSIFIGMSVMLLSFQYFAGNGAKPIRVGEFSPSQVWTGSIFLLFWLMLEVGLTEEFFFRVILQSRITAKLQSVTGGIICSGIVFGLAHAPGMYLRGAGVVEGLGATPSLLAVLSYCICTVSLAGFFLGIIWAHTKNLWLVVMIHAMIDLLPNLPEFIGMWKL